MHSQLRERQTLTWKPPSVEGFRHGKETVTMTSRAGTAAMDRRGSATQRRASIDGRYVASRPVELGRHNHLNMSELFPLR